MTAYGTPIAERPPSTEQQRPPDLRRAERTRVHEDGWAQEDGRAAAIARGLGIFSIGLGAAQVFAPGAVSELIGIPERRNVMRAMGAREIATGIGLLWQEHPAPWLWARIGGDLLDVAGIASSIASRRTNRDRAARALAFAAGLTVLDVLTSQQLSAQRTRDGMRRPVDVERLRRRGVHMHSAVTINRPAGELHHFWRNFENLPRFMTHLHSVRPLDGEHTRWVASGPAGSTVEWDAELISDVPGELIGWRSLEGGSVSHAGSVRFRSAPGGRGTEVHVDMRYRPRAGWAGAAVAKLFGESPQQQIADDLRRFKQLMEAGEITTSEGPRGTCRS